MRLHGLSLPIAKIRLRRNVVRVGRDCAVRQAANGFIDWGPAPSGLKAKANMG